MGDPAPTAGLTVYTIGHSNHPPERLVQLLANQGIEVLVDTRSHPGSRWAPHATRQGLQALLRPAGIKYVFMGDTLGGRPRDPHCYDPQTGKPVYRVIRETGFFREGLARLLDGLSRFRVCIMCAEEDPAHCHRTLLIGPALQENGVQALHIRGDGAVQTDQELGKDPRKVVSGQLSLPLEDEE